MARDDPQAEPKMSSATVLSLGEDGIPVVVAKNKAELAAAGFDGAPRRCLFHLVIPNSVTSIADRAFADCDKMLTVAIPVGVTQLRRDSFRGCVGLTRVVIPDGVVSICEGAFSECTRLTAISLPPSLLSIGARAFFGCQSLLSVAIPGSVAEISAYAFYRCNSLASINIPEGVLRVQAAAFGHCEWLVVASVADSVVEVGPRGQSHLCDVFFGCSRLRCVVGPPELMASSVGRSLSGESGEEKKRRRQALQLQYWTVQTHKLCSEPRRNWVVTILRIASRLRLDERRDESRGLPPLPPEMWFAILELVPRWALGSEGV